MTYSEFYIAEEFIPFELARIFRCSYSLCRSLNNEFVTFTLFTCAMKLLWKTSTGHAGKLIQVTIAMISSNFLFISSGATLSRIAIAVLNITFQPSIKNISQIFNRISTLFCNVLEYSVINQLDEK